MADTPGSFSDALHHNCARIGTAGDQLSALASAFAKTGNQQVARELWQICETLDESTNHIRSGWSSYIGQYVDADQRAFVDNIRAMVGQPA